MATGKFRDNWQNKEPKQLTEGFINYVDKYCYGSYKKESRKYEKLNNWMFSSVAIIGLLVTLLLGLQEFLADKVNERAITLVKTTAFILPLISSFLLLFSIQKGYKQKEELRENARIHSKYLVNQARLNFSVAKTDEDYKTIYKWLNEEILKLQMGHASKYFISHNNSREQ